MSFEEATEVVSEVSAPEVPASTDAAPAQEKTPPELEAAMYIQQGLPVFRASIDKVTGIQAKKVLTALVESPLEQTVPGFTTEEAHKLFNMGTNIQNAKFILFQTSSYEILARHFNTTSGELRNLVEVALRSQVEAEQALAAKKAAEQETAKGEAPSAQPTLEGEQANGS